MVDIVSQSSVSYDSLKTDLLKYVHSLTDYKRTFRDLYEGGPGQTLIELMAAMGTYLNLVALKSRREAYIDEAKLTSSIYGMATTLGYDVNRATAPQYTLTVTCYTSFTQTKETPIGYYNAIPLSLIEDTTFQIGQNTITVALGLWENFSIVSTTGRAYNRYLIQANIDNNLYQLYINNNKINTVRYSELLADADTGSATVLLRTYFTGMYIIFGDGIFGKTINQGDQISFDYFVPAAPSTDQALNLINLTSNVGSVTAGTVLTYGSLQDSNEKIALIASGYNTAKRRLVTQSDYKYISASYNGVVSAAFQKHPGICCTADIAIIGDGGRTFTNTEKTNFLNYMDSFQVLGTTINLVNTIKTNVNVSLIIVIQNTADQNAIENIISQYIKNMCLKLGQFFSISGLFNLALPGVVGVYPQYPITDRQAAYNEFFQLQNLNIQFTNIVNGVKSFGSNATLGYS